MNGLTLFFMEIAQSVGIGTIAGFLASYIMCRRQNRKRTLNIYISYPSTVNDAEKERLEANLERMITAAVKKLSNGEGVVDGVE